MIPKKAHFGHTNTYSLGQESKQMAPAEFKSERWVPE